MDIQAFIQSSCGRWFTQRTCHPIGDLSSVAQTALLKMDLLNLADAKVVSLCSNANIDPALALSAARISWQSTGFQPQPQEEGTLLMAAISSPQSARQGQILQQVSQGPIAQFNFQINADQRLILKGLQDPFVVEERVWFASPNLRLRVSLLKQAEQLQQATWYSEVRIEGIPDSVSAEISQTASAS